jgi:hypothetical protein
MVLMKVLVDVTMFLSIMVKKQHNGKMDLAHWTIWQVKLGG